MRYLLDANAVIALLKDAISPTARRVRRYAPREVGVSAVVIHELDHGAFKSQRVEGNVARVDGLQFPVLEFDQDDARHAGDPSAARVEGNAHRPLRRAHRGAGQGTPVDARHAQHCGVHACAGVEGGGLESRDVIDAHDQEGTEVTEQASRSVTGVR